MKISIIKVVLEPIFEECIRNGITLEEFYYLVSTGTNEMMLLALLDGDRLIKLRDSSSSKLN